ncbi:flagellar basal body rod protein FlgB [Mangrovibacillus cuniculi]|uniref:Flagellar basal body rod protein FlgB n=1 Tax=Mangrovibacillus cuniculi TaxID=2593652 RepID=A0A7S8CAF7_9BACI|nr:flagellar basal body rod protein FlgB [Mangrovibacillus cuniculi]QPC46338.1 flagellar basal body rod protein FlgB [Mangrovibacillus cuniculi]
MKLFSGTITSLESGLAYSSMKQKAISDNIANVDTPGYKAKDVQFKSFLEKEMSNSFPSKKTDDRHIDFSSKETAFNTIVRPNVNYNENNNSVDIDNEMADLATNQIYYNSLVDRLNGKFNSLQSVIRGGK